MRLEPLISHTGILMTFYLSIILDLQNLLKFIINFSTELTTVVKFEVQVQNDAEEAVSVVSLTSSAGGYINGRNSANLELLIDKTSSIYLYVKLKAYFSNKIHKGKTCYSEEQVISMLEFLIDNIFVSFGGDTVSAGRRHTNGYELCPSSSRFIFILIRVWKKFCKSRIIDR
jgi:hypothetical protein